MQLLAGGMNFSTRRMPEWLLCAQPVKTFERSLGASSSTKANPRPEQKEINKHKRSRRQQLVAELDTHDCPDREGGLLNVPEGHNRILQRMQQFWQVREQPQKEQDRKDGSSLSGLPSVEPSHDAVSEESSDSDVGFVEETDGMPLTAKNQRFTQCAPWCEPRGVHP